MTWKSYRFVHLTCQIFSGFNIPDVERPTMRPGDPLPDLNLYPIINDSLSRVHYSVNTRIRYCCTFKKWKGGRFFGRRVYAWLVPSLLWHCWLGARKSIQPVKIEWWGVVVIWLEQGADCLHMVQLMPLSSQNPVISCVIWIQTGFTFLVPAYPGCARKEAV